jgi:GNAT superfamily N-acetyltransferase
MRGGGKPRHPGVVPVDVHTFAERPDLAEIGIPSADVWPEYNLHGDALNPLWGPLCDELPEFQAVVVDRGSGLTVAELHTGPLTWDGIDAHLPSGIDEAIRSVVEGRREGRRSNTLCALAAEILPSAQGRGLATVGVEVMLDVARSHGYGHLIAPVRPSWKERYPLAPIERYVTWRRSDGYSIDPWIRVHQRLGARISTPVPKSMRISGTVAEWEQWTEMVFPESGSYVFPRGLATVHIDREADLGLYYEPNVWLVHDVPVGGPR